MNIMLCGIWKRYVISNVIGKTDCIKKIQGHRNINFFVSGIGTHITKSHLSHLAQCKTFDQNVKWEWKAIDEDIYHLSVIYQSKYIVILPLP